MIVFDNGLHVKEQENPITWMSSHIAKMLTCTKKKGLFLCCNGFIRELGWVYERSALYGLGTGIGLGLLNGREVPCMAWVRELGWVY